MMLQQQRILTCCATTACPASPEAGVSVLVGKVKRKRIPDDQDTLVNSYARRSTHKRGRTPSVLDTVDRIQSLRCFALCMSSLNPGIGRDAMQFSLSPTPGLEDDGAEQAAKPVSAARILGGQQGEAPPLHVHL